MNRIIIRKLIVQGITYRRTIYFNENFTIISGEKTSGKSLILSLIDYCLGKSGKIDLKVQKELNARCDQVLLELEINNEILTLNRNLKKKTDNMGIYFCSFENIDDYTPKIINIKEAMHILMTKLNINEYKIIKYKKHSNQKELQTVSFRDIFRYVYTNQHVLGTNDFLEKKSTFKSNKNPHAFKMMFNLVEADKDAIKEELVEAENKIQGASKVIVGLHSYLQDKDSEDYNDLLAKSDRLNIDIENKKKEKKKIIDNSKSNANAENKLYIKLKQDLEDVTNEIFKLQREKKQLDLSIKSNKILLEEYDVEKKEIEATLEINYKLVISEQNIECPLCNSTVLPHTHETVEATSDTEKMLNKVKKEINNKIKLVTGLIDFEREKIEEINQQIKRLSRKQVIFDEAIVEFSKETNVPFLSQIDSLNSIVNRLEKEREIVKESLRIHRKIDEKNKEIIELNNVLIKLKEKLDSLKISDQERKSIFDFLDKQYKEFMRRLKYETDGETFIHREQYIPFYEGSSVYAHDSGGLLECMQLSYLGAILKSKEEGYALGHPGLLMLDSISKYVGTLQQENDGLQNNLVEQGRNGKGRIKDPEVYEEFYKILIELSNSHQIILVENTPLEKFDRLFTKYTFHKGEKGLIDESENELKEV